VKYFFLSDGWTYARVWEFGGLWDEISWRRKPYIERLTLGIIEKGEIFWLYQVEDAVLMVEVKPTRETSDPAKPFGQVILKRLIDADEAIERLSEAEGIIHQLIKE
jgi:hypothetical protein